MFDAAAMLRLAAVDAYASARCVLLPIPPARAPAERCVEGPQLRIR